MKVYGYLRDQHSVAMAQKVTFSKPQAAIDQGGTKASTRNTNSNSGNA